jgi:hypothetical protein
MILQIYQISYNCNSKNRRWEGRESEREFMWGARGKRGRAEEEAYQ